MSVQNMPKRAHRLKKPTAADRAAKRKVLSASADAKRAHRAKKPTAADRDSKWRVRSVPVTADIRGRMGAANTAKYGSYPTYLNRHAPRISPFPQPEPLPAHVTRGLELARQLDAANRVLSQYGDHIGGRAHSLELYEDTDSAERQQRRLTAELRRRHNAAAAAVVSQRQRYGEL